MLAPPCQINSKDLHSVPSLLWNFFDVVHYQNINRTFSGFESQTELF